MMTIKFDYNKTIEAHCSEAVCREWVEAGFEALCEKYNCIVNFKSCTITGKEEDLKKLNLKY